MMLCAHTVNRYPTPGVNPVILAWVGGGEPLIVVGASGTPSMVGVTL